mgnify:CR=1 FL=1
MLKAYGAVLALIQFPYLCHANPTLQSSRPIFFIAHSIGGLVVKNALVRASQSKRYLEIMEFCHGVAFFGKFLPAVLSSAPKLQNVQANTTTKARLIGGQAICLCQT